MSLDVSRVALEHPELAQLDAGARRLALRALVADGGATTYSAARLSDEIDGFGCLTPFLDDEEVSDVLVNGPAEIWVERRGTLVREPVAFDSEEHLYRLIERLVSLAGCRVDASRPMADAVLTDGSRLHVALPPVAPNGPVLSIRRLPRRRWSLDRLIAAGLLPNEEAEVLKSYVIARKTMVISGGTGTGKTTLLNALLGLVPSSERVVTIEETPELDPACEHRVALVARPPNETGVGGVDLSDLLRAALRMRPDRIVVGEVRGAEASVALSAMSTGHPGSLLTIHASSVTGATCRLVDLAGQGSIYSEKSLRSAVGSAVDVWIHLARIGCERRIVDVSTR